MLAVAVIALTIISAKPACAQTKVSLEASTPDTTGTRLAYAIKQKIRENVGSITLMDRQEDGLIRIHLVTLDPDENTSSQGFRTIYSVVWTVQTLSEPSTTMYLSNQVGSCGSGRISECADGIVAQTDDYASTVRGWIKDFIDKQSKKH